MGNGHGPPRELSNTDYQKIKLGSVVLSGTYEGCIQIGESTYYWIEPDDNTWTLNEGVPDAETQVLITSGIWDKCQDGGDLDWSTRGQFWYEPGSTYQWAGYSGQSVVLHEL
jgi:hypothetical protein